VIGAAHVAATLLTYYAEETTRWQLGAPISERRAAYLGRYLGKCLATLQSFGHEGFLTKTGSSLVRELERSRDVAAVERKEPSTEE
jgi:hypothetical protein